MYLLNLQRKLYHDIYCYYDMKWRIIWTKKDSNEFVQQYKKH